MSEDLYRSGNAWVGQFRGGLAMATTMACAAFGAICGSSLPEVITMGKVAVPQMRKFNYDMKLATASIAAAGSLAILIPPSLAFVLYSILTEQSVGKLFIAGILPGILLTVLFMMTIAVIVWRNPAAAPAGPRTTLKEKLISLKHTWTMLALFTLVMGGIYGGIFTPSEGGAIGAFLAIVISAFQRRLTSEKLWQSLLETIRTTGMIAALITGAFILMRFLAITKLPFSLARFVGGLPIGPYGVLGCIVVFYFIVGMFFDVMGAVILTVPIIYPVVIEVGFDPIWFGVVVVLLIEMGLITPPVGFNVFVLSGATGIPSRTIFQGVWPFVAAIFICLILITIFPQIALFLPRSM